MIGLVMAGGKGTRMSLSEEKLLLKYKKPVIFHTSDEIETSLVMTNQIKSMALALGKAPVILIT